MSRSKAKITARSRFILSGLLTVFAVAIITFGAIKLVAAYNNGFTSFAGDCNNCNVEAPSGNDATFGAAFDASNNPSSLTDLYSTGDIVANSTLGIGTWSDGSFTDGWRKGVVVIDLDATSSAVSLNPEGETIWVYDASLRVQTATTSAIAYQMGTSTISGIDQGATCGATGTCGAATAGHASILSTGTEAVPTALDTFWKFDYQGTDTRDGSGTRYVVPVKSTEYLSCNASTTPAANLQTGGQAAQCQFHYFVVED